MIEKIVGRAAAQPIQFAIGAALVVGVAYFVLNKLGKQAVDTATGLVSGDNFLTSGTPYTGAGAVGTVAAVADKASGGVLSSIGETIGGWLYDTFNPPADDYDPTSGLQSGGKIVAQGAQATDQLWGSIGDVDLRHGATGAW